MKEINKKELSKRILLKKYYLIKSNQLISEIMALFFTREDLGGDIFHSQGKYLLDSLSKLSCINNELGKYSYSKISKFEAIMFFENLKFCMRKTEEIIQLFTSLDILDDSRIYQSTFHLIKKLHTYYSKISELNESPQSMINNNYPIVYLSQKRISSPPCSLVLNEALCVVRSLMLSKNKSAPRIFISYAWPLPENNSNEFWMEDFLSTFVNHLKLSGAIVYRDRSDSRWGYRIQEYMNKIKESDYFILIGSKSLKDKYEKFSYRMIQDEISEAITTKTHVIPILLSGSLAESFPRVVLRNQSIEDW
ncbi:TPA: toll/interleukin-1 receptor domain-containing protein, partial [Legionella pneumophila]|nr:toll/interleukin-1 receptor domain-containing protein [Legionella pneumophila]